MPAGKLPTTFTDPFMRRIAELIDGKRSLEEIAVELGTTIRAVRNVVEKLREAGYIAGIEVHRE